MKLLKISLLTIMVLYVTGCGKAKFEPVDYQCKIDQGYMMCPDGSSARLPTNGIDGRDGLPGIDGSNGADGTMIDIVDPCGDGPGVDEVVIIFADGTVLAWYLNVGFSVLQEGVFYRTTDAQACNFSIVDGAVISN